MKAPQVNASAGQWARCNPQLREQFLVHAHRLLAAGAARLDRAALAALEEPAITGYLCATVNAFLREPEGPAWRDYLACHEDPPVNDSGREGKARDRADLKITTVARPCPELFVEAKRLRDGDSHALSHYVGKDGMGCFLRGRYASAYDFGAMLAYVVSGTTEEWMAALEQRLLRDRRALKIASGAAVWRDAPELPTEILARCSRHGRKGLDPIELFHSFILCHAGG